MKTKIIKREEFKVRNDMTQSLLNEDIKALARDVILNSFDSLKHLKFVEQMTVRQSSGEIEFLININHPNLGRAEIVYSPQVFIERIIREAEEELDRLIEKKTAEAQIEIAKQYFQRKIDETTGILIRNVFIEFDETVGQQGPLSLSLFYQGIKSSPASQPEDYSLQNEFLNRIAEQRKGRYEFYVKEIENSEIGPQLLFSVFYDVTIDVWKKAKAYYKKSSSFKNAVDLIQMAFPELPAKYIERLKYKDNSSPHQLALESTADIIGVPPSISSIRSLQDYLKVSRELREKASKQEIIAAIEHFKSYFNQKCQESDLIKELLEKDKHNISD